MNINAFFGLKMVFNKKKTHKFWNDKCLQTKIQTPQKSVRQADVQGCSRKQQWVTISVMLSREILIKQRFEIGHEDMQREAREVIMNA